MSERTPVLIILSGGMDSTVLAYELHRSYDVHAVSFNYGQKHSKELLCAMTTAVKLGIPHEVIDLSNLGSFLTSSLTDKASPVPEGHYADDNMKSTVVPNRNMIMLSIAAGYAMSKNISLLFYGAHAGDHAIYPDCRPQFVNAMGNALSLAHFEPMLLMAPFINMDKGDICEHGLSLGVPFEDTWTCYKGEEEACGKCGSCVERLEAFAVNHAKDPIKYQSEE